MDAILNTQSENCALSMREIEIFSDGSGGVCELEVLSSPFSGAITFFFDHPYLNEFVNALESIQETLVGEAKLGQQYEDPYIYFHGNGLGHVLVSGLLCIYGEHSQKLEFSFKTDQTALKQFITGLHKASNAEKVT